MPKPPGSDQLTPLELEIMKVLWEIGPASVQAVQEGLAPRRPLAYNTVQTMLNILFRKGKVRRDRQQRPFLYAPAISRSRAAGQAVGDLVDRMFEGSAESLVLSMVRARQLTAEKLAELTALLEAAEDGERESGDEG